jgi:hypothetical protein
MSKHPAKCKKTHSGGGLPYPELSKPFPEDTVVQALRDNAVVKRKLTKEKEELTAEERVKVKKATIASPG